MNVVEEIKRLYVDYGVTLIIPEDDMFTLNKKRVLDLADEIKRLNIPNLELQFPNGLAINTLDEQIIDSLISLGMRNLGPIDFGPQYDISDYGLRTYEAAGVSDKTQEAIDKEVKRLVDEAYQRALEILKRERKSLDVIAKALVEKETLDGEEFEKLVGKPKAKLT